MRCRTGLVVCLAAVAGALGGCTTVIHAPEARRPEGMPSGNRGQSSVMVFATPPVAAVMEDLPEWERPEYGRNDDNLVHRPPTALTAIDEWPQPIPPSLDDLRRRTIRSSADTIIFFDQHGHHGPYAPRGRRQYAPYHRHYTPLPF